MSRGLPSLRLIVQIGSYGVVGVINTSVDVGIFWLLTAQLGLAPLIANVLSFCSGALSSFTLNRHWTFRSRHALDRSGLRVARFAVMTLIVLAASTMFLALMLRFMAPMPAKLMSVAMSFLLGFLLQRYWVFAPAPPSRGRVGPRPPTQS
jgi:putative flippase GtrA